MRLWGRDLRDEETWIFFRKIIVTTVHGYFAKFRCARQVITKIILASVENRLVSTYIMHDKTRKAWNWLGIGLEMAWKWLGDGLEIAATLLQLRGLDLYIV